MLGEGDAPNQVEDVYLREVQYLLLGWFRKERKSSAAMSWAPLMSTLPCSPYCLNKNMLGGRLHCWTNHPVDSTTFPHPPLHRGSSDQQKGGSVQFSCSIMSDSLRPHKPQHARPPCPSPTPGVHPNPCPLSWSCHPTISSSVIPFSSSPQSFPGSGSFQMSQFFASGGQSIGVSASTSVLPTNTQD